MNHPFRPATPPLHLHGWLLLLTLAGTSLQGQDPFTRITTSPMVDRTISNQGAVWADLDGDGWIDLASSAGDWPLITASNNFYRNNRDGTFTRLGPLEAGDFVKEPGNWGLVSVTDYDNDGALDLFVPAGNVRLPAALYRNRGDGKFDRVTNTGPLATDINNWGAACWGDYDGDGHVDLILCNSFGFWDGESNIKNVLYRNNGDGTFSRGGRGTLFTRQFDGLQGGGSSDLDGDGDLDIVVTDATAGPEVYRNDGQGGFTTVLGNTLSTTSGLAITPCFGDYDNDGRMDVFVGMYDGATSYLFHNDGNWKFTRIPMAFPPEMGLGAWGDYDNDGDLDLFINRGQGSVTSNLLYRNDGGGGFTRITSSVVATDTGADTWTPVWGDYDNDGFLDLYITRVDGTGALLYHNNGNTNRWLMVKLRGTASNGAAIGAKVRARSTIFGKEVTQLREIPGGNRCQNDLRAHFGLGDATAVTTLRIEWPSGTVQEFSNVAPNQILNITEPRRPILSMTIPQAGTTQRSLKADPDTRYTLWAADNLAGPWSHLETVTTDANGLASWSDPTTPVPGYRFYKASAATP